MEQLRQKEKPGAVVRAKKPSPSSTGGKTASCGSSRKRLRFSSEEEEQIKVHFGNFSDLKLDNISSVFNGDEENPGIDSKIYKDCKASTSEGYTGTIKPYI